MSGKSEYSDHTIIVVFGASGDVAKKMTYPALFALFSDGRLPPKAQIIGYARSDLGDDKFYEQVTGGLPDEADKSKVDDFKQLNRYVKGSYDKDEDFKHLEDEMKQIADENFDGESNRLYYLALPPSQFTALSAMIKKNNYKGTQHRLVIEKPFGKDTASCKDMMEQIEKDFKEEEIYRIDHFLGHEVARAMTHMRFANAHLFEPILNKDRVAGVKIDLLEDFGCEGRGGYFDEFGLIRDVHQNHLLQLLLLLAMEPPKSLEKDGLRDGKAEILKSIRPIKLSDTVVGQYVKGDSGPGYLEDESVEDKESKTETFASTVLWVDNERWKGVPFILQAGKGLDTNITRVTVQLKQSESPLFGPCAPPEIHFDLVPEEKICFVLQTKEAGLDERQVQAELPLDYKQSFPDKRVPDGYETVLQAALKGDQSMFVREDELLAAWEVFTPLLHALEASDSARPIEYKRGTSGPKEAAELLQRVGFVVSD